MSLDDLTKQSQITFEGSGLIPEIQAYVDSHGLAAGVTILLTNRAFNTSPCLFLFQGSYTAVPSKKQKRSVHDSSSLPWTGIVVTFTNAFRPPSAERYLELVKVCNSKVGSFGNIQKPPFDATLTNKQHRKFLKAADYYGTSKRGVGACLAAVWDPTPIVKIIRKVFNLATIGPGYIWKIAPLGVQATHQDDKRFAKKIEQSSKQQLENQSFRDWHWVAFGSSLDQWSRKRSEAAI
jgi:hypothetical protein